MIYEEVLSFEETKDIKLAAEAFKKVNRNWKSPIKRWYNFTDQKTNDIIYLFDKIYFINMGDSRLEFIHALRDEWVARGFDISFENSSYPFISSTFVQCRLIKSYRS